MKTSSIQTYDLVGHQMVYEVCTERASGLCTSGSACARSHRDAPRRKRLGLGVSELLLDA